MAAIINYTWQSIFCLSFLYGIYWVFLNGEKTFHFNRFYLLICPVLALIFPLLEIPVTFDKPSISLENTSFLKAIQVQEDHVVIGTFSLPEITITDTKLPLLWELKDYLLLGYLLVTSLLFLKLFWQYIQLRQLLEKGWYQTVYKLKGDYFLIPTFGLAPVFSFFDKLFWDDTQQLSEEEEDHIIRHEIEHIRQRHTWDILYYQFLSILFWFNPVIHLMRYSLVDLHEYLADEKVMRQITNKETYPRLIVKMAFKGLDLPIGNYFIRSTTLKRILMMKKKAKINWFKLVMVIPLTVMLFALVSMKTEDGLQLFSQYQNANVHTISRQITSFQDSLDISVKVRRLKNPEHYEWIGALENGKLKAQLGALEYEFSGIDSDDEYIKVRELIRILRANSRMIKTYTNTQTLHTAETKPKPVEGWEYWESYLREQITIPEKEKDLGLSGAVEIEYVVDQDGKLLHPVIKQSFGAGLDNQLLDAIKKPITPRWEPGKKNGKPVAIVMSSRLDFNFAETTARNEFFPEPPHQAQHQAHTSVMFEGDEVFDVVESMPVPPGGMEGWNQYINENLKYSESAKNAGAEGTVYLVFIVTKDGEIKNPEILRGIGHHLDEEAMRLVRESPKWQPGEHKGQKVNVKIRMPILFKAPQHQSGNNSDDLLAGSNDLKKGLIIPSEDFRNHLLKSLRYPAEARIDEEAGTVLVRLHFDQTGQITQTSVVKGISKEIDKEVLTRMKGAPAWKVIAKKDSYQALLPITFNLGNHSEAAKEAKAYFGEGYTVTGYPASMRQPDMAKNHIYKITIINDKLVNFQGKMMRIDTTLKEKISDLLITHQLTPEDLTIQLTAEMGVTMGTVQDVQRALRENGLNRLLYTYKTQQPRGPATKEPGLNYLDEGDAPLVILDGRFINRKKMDEIDPQNIESISVIKGDNAANLYGEASKNGVILITSKGN